VPTVTSVLVSTLPVAVLV